MHTLLVPAGLTYTTYIDYSLHVTAIILQVQQAVVSPTAAAVHDALLSQVG